MQDWIDISVIEWIAVAFGIGAVLLTIVRNRWCWPVGLVQVVLFIAVFWHAKLYSDMLLHVVYVGLQLYGWLQWNQRAAWESHDNPKVIVQSLGTQPLMLCIAVTGGATFGLGFTMSRYTDASIPYGDAFTTVASLVAQILLTRRYLANWYFWIVVDVVAIGIYLQKGLLPTAGLYAVFLVLASIGLVTWLKTPFQKPNSGEVVVEGEASE